MNDKLLNFLGLCRRAGKMKIGYDPVIDAVTNGSAKLVLMAKDISDNTKKKIIAAVDNKMLETLEYNKDELSFALGKMCAVLAIEDKGFAEKTAQLIHTRKTQGGKDYD